MSDDEDEQKYKIKKKIFQNEEENEEQEEQEEDNEEKEEIEEDDATNINNANNINYINNISSKNNKKSMAETDHIEEKHENDLQISLKKTKKPAEYIAQIEELQNELNLEKGINKKLKNNINNEEILQLKNDLNQKKLMLEKLISTNKKQKSALNLLTKQLDKENKKRLKIKSPGTLMITERSERTGTKPDAVDIVLKVKDKELSNATIKMNVLKIENDELKKVLYESEDYNNNINMEDKAKEMNEKIQKCSNEKNLLIKQLKTHKKCIEEQTQYKEQYNNLKLELKQTKSNIHNIISQTLELINSRKKNEKNSLYLGIHSQDDINNSNSNRYNNGTISSPNIHSKKIRIKNQKKN